ncbi:MAG: glycosyltransferase, partial [Candidatus Binataceae bacterium]
HALCSELSKSTPVGVIVANDGRYNAVDMLDGVKVTRVARWCTVMSAPLCPGMVRHIRQSAAHIVHLHLPNPAAMLAYQLSGHSGHLIVTWHSDIVRQHRVMRLLAPFEHRLMRRAAACVVTSPNYLESSARLRAYHDRTRVIPFGIVPERFIRPETGMVMALRAHYGDRVVLAVGRLIYYKGFEFLIRAMRQVNAVLLLVGDGPLRRRLEHEARALGVGDRVHFVGELRDDAMVSHYHAADVFVLPSVARSEAFGIVQLEAMASGRPVVNTRIDSGVPYVSIDGVTGLTVPPREPAALAEAINRLLDNASLRAQYGAAAVRRVREEFSLDLMVRRMRTLYHEVVGDKIIGGSSRQAV